MANEGFTTCTDCNRLLRVEDGPTCPECLAKRPSAEDLSAGEQPAQ